MKKTYQQKILILAGLSFASGFALAVEPPADGDANRPAPPEIEYPEVDPVVPDVRDRLSVLQAELAEARETLVASLADASEEERAEAVAAFRAENAVLVAQIQDLAAELRENAGEYRPERPEIPEVPAEVDEARGELAVLEAELSESRAAVLAELPEDASPAEVAAAIAQWRQANADQVADAEALRGIVNDWSADVRSGRAEDRPDADPALVERREAFQATAQEMRHAREELRLNLRDASEEDRAALIEAFREERREAMQERRDLRRMERNTGGDAGGSRRPGA